MPSQITHILCGREALDILPAGWSVRFPAPAFRLGCQGPDVFYHNRRTKPGGFLYGTRLHRRGWGTYLARFRREALDRGWGPDHPGMAFLAGQGTHGFLDRRTHPFIVYFSGWKVPGRPETDVFRHAHLFLERILDVLTWNLKVGTPFEDCPWQDDLPAPGDFPPDFWTAWAEALHEVFPQISARVDVEVRLKNAVSDTKGFLAATSPAAKDQAVRAARHGAIHYFHPIALPDWDFLNIRRAGWRDPVSGAPRSESFFDLYDQAVGDSRKALGVLADRTGDWEELLGNGSLNLPGPDGLGGTPSFSAPWDFGTLFDREVEARLARG